MPCEHHSYKMHKESHFVSRLLARIRHIPRQNTLSMTSPEQLVKSHMAVFCISPTVPIDQAHAFFFGELSSGIPYIPCPILSKRYLQRKFSESEATNERVRPIHTSFRDPCPFHPPSTCVIQLMVYYYPYPHTHVQGPHTQKMTNHRKRAASRNQRGVIQGRKEEKSGLKMISRGKL